MSNPVLLSICIPTYNRKDAVYKSVTSILDNFNENNIEVIVSDNCSIDGTEEKLRTIQDKRFRYYKNPSNTKWLNLLIAMSYSHGRFAMLLSDEDDIDLEFLDELLCRLDTGDDAKTAIIKYDVYNRLSKSHYHFSSSGSSYYDKITAIFTWGYMSGIIYNSRMILPILKKFDFTDYEKYQKITGEYPHIWIALMICHLGEIVFLDKELIIHARECKQDHAINKNATKEFLWCVNRRFTQEISFCKALRHLQLRSLSASEKIGLYCNRIKDAMAVSGLEYYRTLYGKDFEMILRKYRPEEIEALKYWRRKPRHVVRNICISHKIGNRFIINCLWDNKKEFFMDCLNNYKALLELYYSTIKEIIRTKKYLLLEAHR